MSLSVSKSECGVSLCVSESECEGMSMCVSLRMRESECEWSGCE